MIYIFIGPSSSGKDTFYKYALEKYQYNPIILHTTRPMRDGEEDGKTYHFISKEEMDKLEQDGKLIERRNYNTEYGVWSYATCISSIDLCKKYITINTWEGYQKYLDYFNDKNSILPIYFELDKGTRLERALERERNQKEPKYDELCRRFIADSTDYSDELLEKYAPVIIDNNGTVEETKEQLDKVFKLIK